MAKRLVIQTTHRMTFFLCRSSQTRMFKMKGHIHIEQQLNWFWEIKMWEEVWREYEWSFLFVPRTQFVHCLTDSSDISQNANSRDAPSLLSSFLETVPPCVSSLCAEYLSLEIGQHAAAHCDQLKTEDRATMQQLQRMLNNAKSPCFRAGFLFRASLVLSETSKPSDGIQMRLFRRPRCVVRR